MMIHLTHSQLIYGQVTTASAATLGRIVWQYLTVNKPVILGDCYTWRVCELT